MSSRMRMMVPVLGMLFLFGYTVLAVTRHAREARQTLPQSVGDLSAASLIEVRDGAGQPVLRGTLTFTEERDGDLEGAANLSAAGAAEGASGKAEIEVSTGRDGVRSQELEVEAQGLAAGASYGLHVDGRHAWTFSADGRGEVELELAGGASR